MNNTGLSNTELADAIAATQEMIRSVHDADLRNHVFRKHLSALLAEQLARAVARSTLDALPEYAPWKDAFAALELKKENDNG